MKIIHAKNMHKHPGAYYCGRASYGKTGSVLANPHPIGYKCPICNITHKRGEAIELYRRWLWQKLTEKDKTILLAFSQLSENSVLACWCTDHETPDKEWCHCQVIEKAWYWIKENLK
jgi:hypothetical protein